MKNKIHREASAKEEGRCDKGKRKGSPHHILGYNCAGGCGSLSGRRYLFRYALDTDSESFIKSGSKEDENSSEEKESVSAGLKESEEIRRWFKETACDV